jgi:hypothetical protein
MQLDRVGAPGWRPTLRFMWADRSFVRCPNFQLLARDLAELTSIGLHPVLPTSAAMMRLG